MNKFMNKKSFMLGTATGLIFACVIGLASPALAKSATGTISATYRNIRIYVDGTEKIPSLEPFLYNGTTFVPLRFVSEAFGEKIEWSDANSSIYIGAPPKTISAPGNTETEEEECDYCGIYEQTEKVAGQNSKNSTLARITIDKISGNKYTYELEVDWYYNGKYQRTETGIASANGKSEITIENGMFHPGISKSDTSCMATFESDGSGLSIEKVSQDFIKGASKLALNGRYVKK